MERFAVATKATVGEQCCELVWRVVTSSLVKQEQVPVRQPQSRNFQKLFQDPFRWEREQARHEHFCAT